MSTSTAGRVRKLSIFSQAGSLLCALALTLLSAGSVQAQAEEAISSTGCGPGGAFQGLAGFGELNEHGFPSLYTDQNDISLDLCDETTNDDALCGNPPFGDPTGEGLPFDAPPNVATGNFWHEVFYFLGGTEITFAGGDALIVLAVEGVWDNADEAINDGDQLVFSRIRHRISLPNVPSSVGVYTVTHPFGVDVFDVTQADLDARNGTRAINFTDDCLHGVVDGVIVPTCGVALGDQFTNPTDDTRSRISHYLSWDTGAPQGYIGDPATPHTFTGSPCGTNFLRIEGPGIPGGSIETNLFNLQGRLIATPSPCGDGIVDDGEQCDDGNTEDGDCCSSTCQFDDAGACTDGDPCTSDVCSSGECSSQPVDCGDGDSCTTDSCIGGSCENAPINCDDGNACTTDTCDEIDGCVSTPMDCGDGDPCTDDTCNAGICSNPPTDCDDGNPCTTDTCDEIDGCLSIPIEGCDVEQLILLSLSSDRSSPTPLDGSTVSGDIFVFTDTDSTDRDVRFWIDDPERLGSVYNTERRAPHDLNGTAGNGTAVAFDTTTLTDGTHIITVRVRDAAGVATFAHATFLVDNGGGGPDPVILDLLWTRNADRSLALPLDGATVSGSIFALLSVMNATADSVEFFIDDEAMAGAPVRTDTEAPFDLVGGNATTADPFATDSLSDGPHTLTARATLAGGGVEVETANFEVLNAAPEAPQLRVSSQSDRDPSDLLDGATVGGDIFVFLAPVDGVRNVSFWIDDPTRSGPRVNRENKAPFDLLGGTATVANALDTTTLSEGSHTITARFILNDVVTITHSTFNVAQP